MKKRTVKKKLSYSTHSRRAGQFATKTLATLMVVALLSVSVVSVGGVKANALSGNVSQTNASKTIARHDRRLTLRASVLGITADELKTELKTKTFEQVVKAHGFKDMAAFHTALIGKLKLELKARGWSDAKINDFIARREARYTARNE